MAARLNRNHSDQVIERIKLAQLVNRVQNHALSQLKNIKDGEKIAMTDSELRAATFLIERKLARATAPQQLNVSVTLSELIRQSMGINNEPSPG